jgi:hypothetical protein
MRKFAGAITVVLGGLVLALPGCGGGPVNTSQTARVRHEVTAPPETTNTTSKKPPSATRTTRTTSTEAQSPSPSGSAELTPEQADAMDALLKRDPALVKGMCRLRAQGLFRSGFASAFRQAAPPGVSPHAASDYLIKNYC